MDCKKTVIGDAVVFNGDAKEVLQNCIEDDSIDIIMTSPPYWQMIDYGQEDVGRVNDAMEYVDWFVDFFNILWNKLRKSGIVIFNIRDTYFTKIKGAGGDSGVYGKNLSRTKRRFKPTKVTSPVKERSLIMIPERIMIRLVDSGWLLRNVAIFITKERRSNYRRLQRDFEYVYILAKSNEYFFNDECKYKSNILEAKRISSTEHPAVYSKQLVEELVTCFARKGMVILDPFSGSGTTAVVGINLGLKPIAIELNPQFYDLTIRNIKQAYGELFIGDDVHV